jgi:hypothetical protein
MDWVHASVIFLFFSQMCSRLQAINFVCKLAFLILPLKFLLATK